MDKRIAILLFLVGLAGITLAQGNLADVPVSKTISKTIVLVPGDAINITGEKASILVKGWDKNYVALKITFSAEHTDRMVAARELEFMHYALSRDKNTVDLRNAFILPSGTDRLQSRIKVLMELSIPSSNTLFISNKYGDVEINDLSGNVSAILEFSDMVMNSVSGEIRLQSSYSEVHGEGIASTSFVSNDEESKYSLQLNKGAYSFTSKHGDIDLRLANIQSLAINATHTDVTIQPMELASYNYELLSKEGKIYVPVRFGHLVKKESNQNKLMLSQKPANPSINVKTTFNTITIQ